MKKIILFLICLMFWPALSFAQAACVPGEYNAIVLPQAPSHLTDSRGTGTISKGNGVCLISLKTNKTAQEWEIRRRSLVHRELDTLTGRVIDEDTATRAGGRYLIDCKASDCEAGDAGAYWKIFTKPRQGVNPFSTILLFYGHTIKDDPTSPIGLINRFVLPDTK